MAREKDIGSHAVCPDTPQAIHHVRRTQGVLLQTHPRGKDL